MVIIKQNRFTGKMESEEKFYMKLTSFLNNSQKIKIDKYLYDDEIKQLLRDMKISLNKINERIYYLKENEKN